LYNGLHILDPSGYWGFRFNIFGFGIDIGSDHASVSIAGVAVGYNWEQKEVSVGLKYGLEIGSFGGSFQTGVFYNFSQQQAGVYYGVSAAGQTAEARAYYDFRENQFGSSVRADSPFGNFYANTDGQRSLNGQSLRKQAAQAGAVVQRGAAGALSVLDTEVESVLTKT